MDVLKDMLDKNAVEYTEIRFRSEETLPSINAFVSSFFVLRSILSSSYNYSVKKHSCDTFVLKFETIMRW